MELRRLTPRKYACVIGTCPGIYEITPEKYSCVIGTCSGIYNSKDLENDYLIIGEQVDPKVVGLEKKVGKGEVLIMIKKEIIDEKKE